MRINAGDTRTLKYFRMNKVYELILYITALP